jgi:hypothetical protein
MAYRITEAEHIRDYVIHLKFDDGVEGDIDLESELEGSVFEPLKDLKAFKKFSLHPELRTIVWENGADLAPEFLRERVLSPAAREKKGPYRTE